MTSDPKDQRLFEQCAARVVHFALGAAQASIELLSASGATLADLSKPDLDAAIETIAAIMKPMLRMMDEVQSRPAASRRLTLVDGDESEGRIL